MTTTISFLSPKGGVGKTTTTHHLGGALAAQGRRVLMVDIDPQANLTQGVAGTEFLMRLPLSATAASIYGDAPPIDSLALVRPGGAANLWLVPGSIRMVDHNLPLPGSLPIEAQYALRNYLDELGGRFDFVLIDCPPNLQLCSWAALVASDFLVCPLIPDAFGSHGLWAVPGIVESIRRGPNPRLELLGFLLSLTQPRLTVHRAFEAKIRSLNGRAVFDATIPAAADIKEATMAKRTIHAHKPKSASAARFGELADELLRRIEAAEGCVVGGSAA